MTEDCHGFYWDVPVCGDWEQVDAKYICWLLANLGYAGPRNWEWEITTVKRKVMHTVRFRTSEDAVAFKLKFEL